MRLPVSTPAWSRGSEVPSPLEAGIAPGNPLHFHHPWRSGEGQGGGVDETQVNNAVREPIEAVVP